MSKMLATQLTGIFNRLNEQELDIQMAAQCLIQAIGGEGHVYVKGYNDLKWFEKYILTSEEKLASSMALDDLTSFSELDSTDRILLFSPYVTDDLTKDLEYLLDAQHEVVLITNPSKSYVIPEHLIHFINLSTPRAIVMTEDYDKVVTPHNIAMNFIYYEIYIQMIEMIRDLDL
ncbi:DUF2529 family protein [Staphylococcus hyicus]|uniref:DUF2529 family protein n=1 Tax=Staphylococcus hyicus TaxID=1284 RepID=UPI00208F4F8C|nr:DUF2529 family protein [Staphylococcus hyicus]MCO4329357.1 DUF2529 domain-containing protein [Staphylococcus hyicus]MCO4331469.1 DUF2529 domain-containing protein [Staphylococcus hyicus]MCO4333501.1 DUF2529 domain-containing protein [Staphylococcus hyicus]MCO4336661.1 DUF2529 domain-containing protein [Staphylococcus hyicus]UWF57487.1 DUF2529 domain-containing protein [Staphylococcus hyicus]